MTPLAPFTTMQGIAWPGVTAPAGAAMLALQWQLERSQWWPLAALRDHQFRQLRLLIAHAVAQVPHYQRTRRAGGAGSVDTLDAKSFLDWPILKKGAVMDDEAALHARSIPDGHGALQETRTTGSTGHPVRVRQTLVSQFYAQALELREHLWHERDFSRTLGVIRRRGPFGREPGWGIPNAMFDTGPSVTFSLAEDLDRQLDWLIAARPAYLLTRASALSALLRRSAETGKVPSGLVEAITMSETLARDVPALARDLWHARVVDTYSCEEVAGIACQCPGGEHYLVHGENVYLEVLRDDGSPCDPGEIGRVVVTALHNFAMPLIRYDLGDYAVVGERCRSGRGLPVLNRIVGRVRNMMRDPTGRMFWPGFHADDFLGVAPIRQVQLVQPALDRIEVRYVSARPLNESERSQVCAALADRLGYDFTFDFTHVASIERTPGEKFEDFVSLISQ